jgi:hypothetical protein
MVVVGVLCFWPRSVVVLCFGKEGMPYVFHAAKAKLGLGPDTVGGRNPEIGPDKGTLLLLCCRLIGWYVVSTTTQLVGHNACW